MRRVLAIGILVFSLVLAACGSTKPSPARGVFGLDEYATARLADGRILIVGGRRYREGKVAEAMLCDPSSRQWASAGAMRAARVGHSATLLADGRVFVVGGTSDTFLRTGALTSTELYDPGSGRWTAAAAAPGPHTRHVAVRLRDGRVLIAGGRSGEGSGADFLAMVDVYDPQANQWQRMAPLGEPREQHTAVVLRDGRVLVVGGRALTATQWAATAEIYDPQVDRWQRIASPLSQRHVNAPARLLDDGRVLLLDQEVGFTEEIYDPATDRWERASTDVPYEGQGRPPCP